MSDVSLSTDNYTTSRTLSTGKASSSTSTKNKTSDLDATDFINLMVTELKNQDFMNPMDNTQYVSQMAQMSSMQAMQQLSSYSKSNYATSLVGKMVTATRAGDGANGKETTSGIVKKVALENNEYVAYVGDNEKSYKLSQIESISDPSSLSVNPGNLVPSYSDVTKSSATVNWALPTEDSNTQQGLTYQVLYSTSGMIDTVDKCSKATNAATVKGATDAKNLTAQLNNLNPNTTYYFNILVTDANGKQSLYAGRSFTTKSA